jgi:hypothetical protein
MRRLIVIAFFFEIGVALLVVPWSAFWDRNYFAESVPLIHAVITNNFVRGAVSGLGLLNIVSGLAEVVSLMLGRHTDVAPLTLSRHAEK